MKKYILALLITAGLVMAVVSPTLVLAAPADDACAGITAAGGTCDSGDAAKAGFEKIITTVIDILSVIVGAAAVIMIIIGGFRYVASAGDANATKAGKETILYALIGLAIVIFAQIVVSFVLSKL